MKTKIIQSVRVPSLIVAAGLQIFPMARTVMPADGGGPDRPAEDDGQDIRRRAGGGHDGARHWKNLQRRRHDQGGHADGLDNFCFHKRISL